MFTINYFEFFEISAHWMCEWTCYFSMQVYHWVWRWGARWTNHYHSCCCWSGWPGNSVARWPGRGSSAHCCSAVQHGCLGRHFCTSYMLCLQSFICIHLAVRHQSFRGLYEEHRQPREDCIFASNWSKLHQNGQNEWSTTRLIPLYFARAVDRCCDKWQRARIWGNWGEFYFIMIALNYNIIVQWL